MISHEAFYERIETYCKHCEFWTGYACRKGHLASSSTGCPIRRFAPINGADFDPDCDPDPPTETNMSCCGEVPTGDLPNMSWNQVLIHFAMSMVKWGRAGMPVVSDKVHGERYRGKCLKCPHRKDFWCMKCRCVAYLKTKIATEQCADNPPRWLRFG